MNWENMMRRGVATAAIMTLLSLMLCKPSQAQTADAMVARSVVESTDFSRLQHVFEKARKGGKVTFAVIGGSITARANATTPENRYANRIAQWWRDASFCGREFDANFLRDLPPNVDWCGENGEFHTFVFDGPLFVRFVPFQITEIYDYQLPDNFGAARFSYAKLK